MIKLIDLLEVSETGKNANSESLGGYKGFIKPEEFEFWEDGDFRLHDRFILKPTNVKNEWIAKRHYP